MLQPGSIVAGKFQIERVLGAGGMGVVAVAMHLQLDQRVALKVLHAEAAANPETVQRFLREARAAARLKSEHICKVTDTGQLDNGAPYIVMELLEGHELAGLVARGPVAPQFAIDYIVQACVGLAEAHSHGIVHRDLKPANLFVTRRLDGSPLIKILDFGIAKTQTTAASGLTQTSMVMGTPGYMAPEQLRSTKDADARADIWALGVILYQLLSGRLPFPANSITEFAVKTAMEPPDPIDLPPDLRAIVMRCLEKEPNARFPDVATLAQALAPFGGPTARANAQLAMTLLGPSLGAASTMMAPHAKVPTTLQIASGAAPAAPTAAKRSGANKGVLIGAGLLAAAVLGGVVVVAMTSKHDAPAPPAPTTASVATAAPPSSTTATVPAAAPVPTPAAAPAPTPAPVETPAAPVDRPATTPAPVETPTAPTEKVATRAPAKHSLAKATPQTPATAPFVPTAPTPPPSPAPPGASIADKIKIFDNAIATRHCQRAANLIRDLYSQGQQYMEKVQSCMKARGEALQNYTSAEAEPWIIALSEDMAEIGQPQVAQQQLDGYYASRGIKACQAKDAATVKYVYPKVKAANLRDSLQKICKLNGIAL